jgi:CubicO group peptidase (beta-lactamase class C family)
VARTTRVVTPAAEVARTSPFHPRLGYGFLWWVLDPAARSATPDGPPSRPRLSPPGGPADPWAGAYTATGAYGQYLTVLPALDVVIAHKVFAPPPPPPARQVREDAYLDRLLPLVVAAVTPRGR